MAASAMAPWPPRLKPAAMFGLCFVLSGTWVLLTVDWHLMIMRSSKGGERTPAPVADAAHIPRVLATACESKYLRHALNLAASALHWGADQVWIYDIGIDSATVERLLRCPSAQTGVVRLRRGSWVPHWEHSVKDFGWKGPVVKDAVDEAGMALYLDAGSEVRGPLGPVFDIIRKEGCILFKGQDASAARWTHPSSAHALGIGMDILRGRSSFWAGGQGFLRGSAPYASLLVPFAVASLRKEAIAPEGSGLRNHRQDQSAFTLLAYRANLTKHYTSLLAATRPSKKGLFHDPTQPAEKTIWTARGTSLAYLRNGTRRSREIRCFAQAAGGLN